MAHGDNRGLKLPPKVAPIQVVIVPIYKNLEQLEKITSVVSPIVEELKQYIYENDFDLEFIIKQQLSAYLPVISGARMLKDYLDYLFPA